MFFDFFFDAELYLLSMCDRFGDRFDFVLEDLGIERAYLLGT